MPRFTLLVVDDEPPIRRVVRNAFEPDFASVLEAGSGQAGLDAAAAARPDLIILDLGLPDLSGVEVCRELRGWCTAPVVVLSARHTEAEKVAALDAGADDYVTKPFSTTELQARVRAQLRRSVMRASEGAAGGRVEVAGLVIDLVCRSVRRDGAAVHLTPIEWGLLRTLVVHVGRTMTHQQLFHEVWARAHGDAQQNLRVHVASLRRKLESDPVRPRFLITEPGVGYRFEAGA